MKIIKGNIRWVSMYVPEITYNYSLDGKKYTKTEVGEQPKYSVKPHSLKNQPIQIIVQNKSHNKATHNSIGHYLRNSLFLMVLGLVVIVVGILTFEE